MPRERTRISEYVRGGNGQVESKLGRDLAIGEATNAIGAEEATHGRLALAVLRSLAGLLQAVLLALLGPGVTSEEAGLLQ